MASFTTKDATTIRDDILRTLRNGLVARGISNPQLGPGSHEFVLATAIANEIAIVNLNVQIKGDAQMPDSATGSDLDRVAAQYGLTRRVAGPSIGYTILSSVASPFIPTGSQLVDSQGLRYAVTSGGTYANGASIQVQAIDTGYATNHIAGDVLRWVTAPPFSDNKTIVATAGLNGGVDAEGDEDLRTRLLGRLQNPPNNANWNQVNAIAEASNTVVQKAFCYPGVNGPSTVHVAVTRAAQIVTAATPTLNSTSKNRDVDATILSSLIVPYIQGQLPEYVESVITTVTDLPNDVAIGLSLPASQASVPAGPGGGWIDGTPWPSTTSFVSVTGVTSSTVFTVNATTAPQSNVSHICFLDPTTWLLNKAKVLSFTGSSGAYVITIDTPFPNITAGYYIWPDSTNSQLYVNAILTAFGQMGPGEKTSNANNLSRGYRHPTPTNSWPYSLTATQLRAISNVGPEVLDVSWLSRTFTGAPTVPGAVSSAPNIFVPRNIAFYPM